MDLAESFPMSFSWYFSPLKSASMELETGTPSVRPTKSLLELDRKLGFHMAVRANTRQFTRKNKNTAFDLKHLIYFRMRETPGSIEWPTSKYFRFRMISYCLICWSRAGHGRYIIWTHVQVMQGEHASLQTHINLACYLSQYIQAPSSFFSFCVFL